MKNRHKILIILGFTLVGIGLYIFDPPISQTVKFKEYEVDYNWRIFNNSFCNIRRFGHCATNDFNKKNAEINLAKILIEHYDGQQEYKTKIEEIVKNNALLKSRYFELTNNSDVTLDYLVKYKDGLFMRMYIE